MPSPSKRKNLKDVVKAGPDQIAAVATVATMAKPKKAPRGRTAINPSAVIDPQDKVKPDTSHPHIENTERAESSRPTGAGFGRHRGDRRDTNPTYTGNQKHKARGAQARTSAKTRKR